MKNIAAFIGVTLIFSMGNIASAEDDMAAQAKQGKAIYDKHCAECHGIELQGAIGSSFNDHIWNYGGHKWAIMGNIKFGIPNMEMPAWKDILSDDEVKSVALFIIDHDKNSSAPSPTIPKTFKTGLYDLKLEILNDSLDEPWAIAFLDKDHALVTDKTGALYQMNNGKIADKAISGLPNDITTVGQSGLLDVILDPEYDENGWIYLSYSQELTKKDGQKRGDAMTRLIRGQIKQGAWVNQQVLFEAPKDQYSQTRHHYGSRIAFDGAGYLYFSVGDRGAKKQAQDVSWPNGKIHRIHKDGSIPKDNPFVKQKGAMASIYSYGHRNPQGMSVDPVTKKVWVTEHGPMGGDELNLIRPAINYGWPVITYGLNYDGSILADSSEKEDMEQPVKHWTPSTAVSDIDFYRGDLFPKWENNLLVGSLKYEDLRRLVIEGDKVVAEEVILKSVGRIRSVTVAPDGAIYVLANGPSLIIRLTPKE